MTSDQLRLRALSILDRIGGDWDAFDALSDEPGRRVHSLFAGLYRCTTQSWLSHLTAHPNPAFAYLVIIRFYDLYRKVTVAISANDTQNLPHYWRRYFNLAKSQTIKTPISHHLVLISLATWAHTRHDLAIAVRQAYEDYKTQFGEKPDLETYKSSVTGGETGAAFCEAALDFIEIHHRAQIGWRHIVLGFYSANIRILRFVWLPVFQSWRKAAWNDACSWIEAGTSRKTVSVPGNPG
ncbi:DUF5995 family protein [Hoeflea sp. TYP-13]|uniref:DUF5995 family protein n=1 Tax=Hoeflea sp. TYP-13 TaxID=3230023 RepID=UPI0034C68516